jgi:hypothetical protein
LTVCDGHNPTMLKSVGFGYPVGLIHASTVKLTLFKGINDVNIACLADTLNEAACPKYPVTNEGRFGDENPL